jgi:alpha-L-rhamnosidase
VTMAAFDDRAMTYEALRDFARSQRRYWPDGRVNVIYPNDDGARDIPDSTEQYVEWVWKVYETTGDLDQAATLYPVVRNISDYLSRAINPRTGLVTNLPGGGADYLYGLVDWPPQSRFGYDMATAARTTVNLLAVDDFRAVADLGEALGRPAAEVNEQRSRATRLATAIHTRLRRGDGVLVDGLEADGSPSKHASQLANAYALAFHLVPASDMPAVANHVVGLGNETGVSTFSNLLVGLHNAGRDQALVAAITDPSRPGYAQIMKEGATFTWESWDARQTGDSESHGFGATVLTVLQDDILGVSLTAPGAATINVQTPQLVPMQASGVYVTQRWRIPISWERAAPGHFSLDVMVPDNVVATVHIPALKVNEVSDGRQAIAHDPGVTSVRMAPGEVVLTVGSGHYHFTVPSTAPSPNHASAWLYALAAAAVLALALIARSIARSSWRRPVAG